MGDGHYQQKATHTLLCVCFIRLTKLPLWQTRKQLEKRERLVIIDDFNSFYEWSSEGLQAFWPPSLQFSWSLFGLVQYSTQAMVTHAKIKEQPQHDVFQVSKVKVLRNITHPLTDHMNTDSFDQFKCLSIGDPVL